MFEFASALRGTADESASAQRACSVGPVFSSDGRLVLSESFTAYAPIADKGMFEASLNMRLKQDDYVECWRIWDCCSKDWADIDLTLYRFEDYDLVVRSCDEGVCVWHGALDQYGRVLASRNGSDCNEKCWQWGRMSV